MSLRIAILIDALGWELVREFSFLEGVATVRLPVRTVLGYSTAAIPSILTGLSPQEHGLWNLLYYAPGQSPFAWTRALDIIPERFAENRYLRYGVKRLSKTLGGYRGYFSSYRVPLRELRFFSICEKENIYRPGGVPGSRTIFDELESAGVDYRAFSYHDGSDRHLLQEAHHALSRPTLRFLFLYLSEFDAYLHTNIEDREKVRERMAWYSGEVAALLEDARRRHGQVELQVFSDHGMTPTRRTVDAAAVVAASGMVPRRDYLAIYDSTMARFWFFSENARRRITAVLEGLSGGRILSVAELERERIHFSDGRYGQLIFLMDPGVLITPSHMGAARIPGMHGFHPDDPTCSAAFLSTGPPSGQLASITDLRRTILGGLTRV